MSDPKKKKRRSLLDLMGTLATREDRITSTPEQSRRTLGLMAMLGAGATPGVGEAMDAADLTTGVRDHQWGKAALGGLGLALPFVAMGSLKRVGGEMADAMPSGSIIKPRGEFVRPDVAPSAMGDIEGQLARMDATKRPLVPWSKAPEEARNEYLSSLEGIRNPTRATDVVSGARGPEVPEVHASLKHIAPLSALAMALGLRNRDRQR